MDYMSRPNRSVKSCWRILLVVIYFDDWNLHWQLSCQLVASLVFQTPWSSPITLGDSKNTDIKHHEPSSRNREPLAKKEKGGVLPRQCLGVPRSWVPTNFDSSSHNSKPIAAIILIRVQHYSQGHFLTVAKSSHCFHGYSKYANPKTRQFFHQILSDLWAKLGLTVWKISPNCKEIVWQPH